MAAKPRVLVLGGAGMIGRNFVKYLVDRDLVSVVRVADKTMPEISYFRHGRSYCIRFSRVLTYASLVILYMQRPAQASVR